MELTTEDLERLVTWYRKISEANQNEHGDSYLANRIERELNSHWLEEDIKANESTGRWGEGFSFAD